MKICIMSGMYPPIRTGTSFYTANLSNALKKAGHQVSVICLQSDEPVQDEDDVTRLPALKIPLYFFKHFRIVSCYPGNYLRVWRILKKNAPDAIILVNQYLDIARSEEHTYELKTRPDV